MDKVGSVAYTVPFHATLSGQVRTRAAGSPGVPYVRVCATPIGELNVTATDPLTCVKGANLAHNGMVVTDTKQVHRAYTVTDGENDFNEPSLEMAYDSYATVKLMNYANVTEVHVCGSWYQSNASKITVKLSDSDPKDFGGKDDFGPECYDRGALMPDKRQGYH